MKNASDRGRRPPAKNRREAKTGRVVQRLLTAVDRLLVAAERAKAARKELQRLADERGQTDG